MYGLIVVERAAVGRSLQAIVRGRLCFVAVLPRLPFRLAAIAVLSSLCIHRSKWIAVFATT